MNGYVITDRGIDALDLFEHPSVRYAAALQDGKGIAAFDADAEEFRAFGRVLIAQEPHPDYPDTWPDWYRKAAPKRAIATGRECFALLPMIFEQYAHEADVITGCVRVADLYVVGESTETWLLAESDGIATLGLGWASAVMEYRDKRLEDALVRNTG